MSEQKFVRIYTIQREAQTMVCTALF